MVLIIVIKNQTTKHIHVHSDHPLSITKQFKSSLKNGYQRYHHQNIYSTKQFHVMSKVSPNEAATKN